MRYFVGFLVALALIVGVFVLILRGFGGHRGVQSQLTDYAQTETVVRMTIEGKVDADQDHRSAQITIGRSSNTINLIQGYQGNVLKTQSYNSNEDAYATFLRALQLQGFARGNTDPARQDSRGVCPTGKVYTFEVITGSATVQKLWTTSCGGGTFKGNQQMVRQLFRNQIPDYTNFIAGAGLV